MSVFAYDHVHRFSVLFRLIFCTCGGRPSSPMPLDVWRVAPVVTACIFVRVAKIFGWWWRLWRTMVSPTRRWRRLVGSRTRKNCSGVYLKATQQMCPLIITGIVLVGCLPWIKWCRGWRLHDRTFLAVNGWRYTDVTAVFVEAILHAFDGEDVFAELNFVLARLWPFVAASRFDDAPNILQVSLQRVS